MLRIDADRLRALMDARQVSARRLSLRADVTTETVHRMLAGGADAIAGTVARIAQVLGVEPIDLTAEGRPLRDVLC